MDKLIGKITDEEKEQVKEFKRRDESIYKMLEKLTAQQYKLEADQDQWFIAIREKYGFDSKTTITIEHDTGDIYEKVQNDNQ